MSLIKKVTKEPLIALLYITLFITVAMRFLWLGTFPPGAAHDEFDMVLSSRAIAHTGRDISGVPFPSFFVRTQMEARQTNVIPFLLSLYFRFVNPNLFVVRLPFVLINILLAIGLVKLVSVFEKDKLLILTLLLVFFTNPWSFVFSRVTFAAPTALMFLVWGSYFWFRKNPKFISSLILFVLSSLCYMGSLAITPLIVIGFVLYRLFIMKNINIRKSAIFIALFAITVSLYILVSYSIEGGTIKLRESEVTDFQDIGTPEIVDLARRRSIEFPGKNLFINKYTVIVRNSIADYLNSFNTQSLFVAGDPRINYAFVDHGLLYYADFFLIFIGILYLKKKNKKLFGLLLVTVLIAPFGPAINNILYTIIYRAFPLLMVFIVFITFGLWKLFKTSFKYLALLTYLLLFINFLAFYFFQYPVSLEENFDVAERTAVNFALREMRQGKEVLVVAQVPYHFTKQFVFYAGNLDEYIIPVQNTYKIGSVTITDKCQFDENSVVIVEQTLDCDETNSNYLAIQQQKDAGYVYKIYGSNICEVEKLDEYKRFHKISDYGIENLNSTTFCNRWIFRPI